VTVNPWETLIARVAAPSFQSSGRHSGSRYTQQDVVNGLVARGVPEIAAQGFAINYTDESGLDPTINEINPASGTRGGIGLAQWTGPRRVALENFAQARGASPLDFGLQLDFTAHEANTTERAAAQRIYAAKTPAEAAVSVLNNFERPAEVHRARREQKYLSGNFGGGSAASAPAPEKFNRLWLDLIAK